MRNAVRLRVTAFSLALLLVISFQVSTMTAQTTATPNTPSLAEAQEFIAHAETRLQELSVKASRASWVQSNFITDDTEQISAEANEALIGATTALAKQATRFDNLQMPADLTRKMLLLKLSAAVPAPAPSDPKELTEMARIGTSLEADYGKGKYCPKSGKNAGKCLDIGQVEQIMATSTDPDEVKDVWVGWHSIGPPMRDRYSRWVELGNKGARQMGFPDLGAMWRAGYGMTPEQFNVEVERLYQYRAMCRDAGFTGPLHRCSFYGNKAAGANLNTMLEMGQSKPWPDALYALTGERQMDAGAMLEDFAPLKQWLDEQGEVKLLV